MKISDIDPLATSVKGGIEPGTPLAEMINDPDKNIVLRVVDPELHKVVFVQKDDNGDELKQEFTLSGLTLEEPAG